MNYELNEEHLLIWTCIFFRIFVILMFLPGSSYISTRIKSTIALALSIAILPLIEINSISNPIICIAQEALIGFFIVSIIIISFSTISTAGNIIASQIGLSSVVSFNHSIGEQDVVLSNFFTLTCVTALFVSDYHYIIIEYIIQSYDFFSNEFLSSDFSSAIVQAISQSFVTAMKISSVMLVIGTISYLATCMLGRLVPQIQFFFLFMPVQVWIGLLTLMLILHRIIESYINSSILPEFG